MAPARNVVLVTVDCLRQDFVSGDWADTPFLEELAETGIEYRNLHATTTTTAPSVASILTGMYSERNGVNSLREAKLNPDVPTMPKLFSDAGFESLGLILPPLVEEIGFHRGFDRYHYRRNDEYLVGDWYETAVERIDDLPEPFFVYLHLWELHDPVPRDDLPPEFDRSRYGANPYARMVSALDRSLEDFFQSLPDNTVRVVHADHGESISWQYSQWQRLVKAARDRLRYDHGFDTRKLERIVNRAVDRIAPSYDDHFIESEHGETIFDFTTNVPFIVDGPTTEPATVTEQCRQVDVLPTLLDLVDVSVPTNLDGESLLPPDTVEDRTAYLRACGASLRGEQNWQRGIRTPEHKLITYPQRDWSPELYELSTDEKELQNRAPSRRSVRRELERQLPDQELMDVGDAGIDDHLRDLGYL